MLGFCTKIPKPTAWRGGVQILRKEEKDCRLLDRCEAKLVHCDGSVQNMCDKPCQNEELKQKLEEALPTLQECDLDKASRLCKAKTEVGCDGFHTKVPLDVTKEARRKIVKFLEKV